MISTGPIDITQNVAKQKATASFGAVQNLLAGVLKGLLSTTGADPMWIDVIHLHEDGTKKTSTLKAFTQEVVKDQNMPKTVLFKQACKDSDTLAVEFPPKVAENLSRLKRDANAEMLRPAIDLIKYAAKQKNGRNIAIAQGPVHPQDINNPNKYVSEKGKASSVNENENGVKFAYSDKWLIKQLRVMGYFGQGE